MKLPIEILCYSSQKTWAFGAPGLNGVKSTAVAIDPIDDHAIVTSLIGDVLYGIGLRGDDCEGQSEIFFIRRVYPPQVPVRAHPLVSCDEVMAHLFAREVCAGIT